MNRLEAKSTIEALAASCKFDQERIRQLEHHRLFTDGDESLALLVTMVDNLKGNESCINQLRELLP